MFFMFGSMHNRIYLDWDLGTSNNEITHHHSYHESRERFEGGMRKLEAPQATLCNPRFLILVSPTQSSFKPSTHARLITSLS